MQDIVICINAHTKLVRDTGIDIWHCMFIFGRYSQASDIHAVLYYKNEKNRMGIAISVI